VTDEELTAQLADRISNLAQSGAYDARRLAAGLLPVVRRYGDQRAAEALKAAAGSLDWSWQWASDGLRPTLRHVEAGLRARAAALRGQADQ
jgi:hypothetical protein